MISVTHCFCFPPRYTHFYQTSVVDFSLNGKFKPLLNMSKTQRSWATFLRLASWSVAALFLRRLPWECITIFFILSTLYTGLLFTIHNLVVSYFFCSKVCVCVCVCVSPDCGKFLSHHFDHENTLIQYLWTQSF